MYDMYQWTEYNVLCAWKCVSCYMNDDCMNDNLSLSFYFSSAMMRRRECILCLLSE